MKILLLTIKGKTHDIIGLCEDPMNKYRIRQCMYIVNGKFIPIGKSDHVGNGVKKADGSIDWSKKRTINVQDITNSDIATKYMKAAK